MPNPASPDANAPIPISGNGLRDLGSLSVSNHHSSRDLRCKGKGQSEECGEKEQCNVGENRGGYGRRKRGETRVLRLFMSEYSTGCPTVLLTLMDA